MNAKSNAHTKMDVSNPVFDLFHMLENHYKYFCPSTYDETRLLDNVMILFNLIPFCLFVGLYVIGWLSPYTYHLFMANGTTLMNFVIGIGINLLIKNDSYPSCSLTKSSHVDLNVATVTFVVTFSLGVNYRHHRRVNHATSTFMWLCHVMGGLFFIGAMVSVDLYLQLYWAFDIFIGASIGIIWALLLVVILVDIIEPRLRTSRIMQFTCWVTCKSDERIASFWKTDEELGFHSKRASSSPSNENVRYIPVATIPSHFSSS